MRQARWGALMAEPGERPNNSYHVMVHERLRPYEARECLRIKARQWACLDRSVGGTTSSRITRIAAECGVPIDTVRDTLRYVVVNTGRMTLYHRGIDAERLLAAARADAALHHYIRTVVELYVAADNRFTRDFFVSDPGGALAEEFGAIEHEGRWYMADNLPSCFACESPIFPDENSTTVYTDSDRRDSYDVHDDCLDDCAAQRCDLSGYWFDTDEVDFVTLDDTGDTVCSGFCEANGMIVEEDELDEDGDETGDTVWRRAASAGRRVDSSGRLAGYHAAPRPWRNTPPPPNGFVGVELEVGFKGGETARAKFLTALADSTGRAKDLPFIFERDGSLDGNVPGGMEIISDPLALHAGYQAKKAPWRGLLNALYKAGGEGWKHRAHAGIHVNLCVADESDASIFKYASFIGNARAMSKFIAGRKTIFGTDDGYWKIDPYLLRGDQRATYMESQFSHGKYSAVNRRSRQCLETRIFGSNIRYEGFMACVEYCVAVMEFVRPLHVLDVSSPTIAGEFRNWLGSVHARFPNLCARLGIVPHEKGAAVPSTSIVTPALLAA